MVMMFWVENVFNTYNIVSAIFCCRMKFENVYFISIKLLGRSPCICSLKRLNFLSKKSNNLLSPVRWYDGWCSYFAQYSFDAAIEDKPCLDVYLDTSTISCYKCPSLRNLEKFQYPSSLSFGNFLYQLLWLWLVNFKVIFRSQLLVLFFVVFHGLLQYQVWI